MEKLFEVLSEEKLHINVAKSKLFVKWIRFLGCIIGVNEIAMDPEKVRAIVEMPPPRRTQDEVRCFLGMIGFYRRHLSSFAELARPLTDLAGSCCTRSW